MFNAIVNFFCTPSSDGIDYDAFHLAIREGDMPQIQAWFEESADIEKPTSDARGFTSLALAVAHKQTAVVEFLLEKNASVHAVDKEGNTLLALAAYSNQLELVEYFLDQDIPIDCKGSRENTPLMVAGWKGNIEVVKFLLLRGANVNALNKFGDTALIMASRVNRLNVVEFLLEQEGVLIDVKGEKQNTALMAASEAGHTDVVRCLVQKGASLNSINNEGHTAFTLAKKYKRVSTFLFLNQSGELTLQERLDAIKFKGVIPEKLLCPISWEIMTDPLTLSTGHTFDRKSMIGHSVSAGDKLTCPNTRTPIKHKELEFETNVLMKQMCVEFVVAREEESKLQSEQSSTIIIQEHCIEKSAPNLYRLFPPLNKNRENNEEDESDEETNELTSLVDMLNAV